MAIDNKDKKVLKSSIEREQNEVACSAECEKIKGSKNLNVPPLRFPEFSGEWENTSLGEIGKTFNGLIGKSGSDFGQGFPYITYKSIFDDSKIDISRVEYVEISDVERKKKTQNNVQYGDVFFTTSSETPDEVGMSSVLLDEVKDCYLNSFCFGYRLNSLSKTIPEYMRFYLRSQTIRKKMFVFAQGSTRFNISKSEVMGMSISIPEIEEQKKIAKLLNLIDERIATQNKIIEDLQSLIKGLTVTLTTKGMPNTTISQCLECHNSTLQESEVLHNGLYKVFGAGGLAGYTDVAQMAGDAILIIKDGSGVGTTLYVQGDFSVIGTLNYLTVIGNNDLRYLYFALSVFNFQPYKTGMAIPHIYFKDYGKAKIYCPPLAEQKRVANVLDKLESKLFVEQELLASFNQHKQHLLQQMFI